MQIGKLDNSWCRGWRPILRLRFGRFRLCRRIGLSCWNLRQCSRIISFAHTGDQLLAVKGMGNRRTRCRLSFRRCLAIHRSVSKQDVRDFLIIVSVLLAALLLLLIFWRCLSFEHEDIVYNFLWLTRCRRDFLCSNPRCRSSCLR